MGMPLSCGKPFCAPGDHHPLCKLAAQPAPVQEHVKDNSNYRLDPPRLDPLYTTPPAAQRQWIGLTNDEINEFAAGCHLGNSVQGAIYKAEAKLKEKNT